MTELGALTEAELAKLIAAHSAPGTPNMEAWPYSAARQQRDKGYGRVVFLRGLIEFTSHCRRDCFYCGLRHSNTGARRYRLTQGEILACCQQGHALGFRSFVLQGGEDEGWGDSALCALVAAIKEKWPGCAVTLSVGERPAASYRALRRAGADRYLLRHETANPAHYSRLHPRGSSLESRKRCLWALREAGFQVGAGFMVGSPGQTAACLAQDLLLLRELQPEMVGIGPFLPHGQTPFATRPPGGLGQSLLMLALARLMLPAALLPATTALESLRPGGRELGFAAGANVAMPNLSPAGVRGAYSLYDGKAAFGAEAAEGLAALNARIRAAGLCPHMGRGDHAAFVRENSGGPGQGSH